MSFYSAAAASAAPQVASINHNVLPTFPSATHHTRISRVAQLDSSLLDAELASILSAPVLSTLSSSLKSNYAHELTLLLRFTLIHLALKRDSASYGAKLQNLIFSSDLRNSKHIRKRWLYVLLATLPAYLYDKLRDYMLVHGWPDYPSPRSSLRTLANSLAISLNINKTGYNVARVRRELKRLAWDTVARLEKIWSFAKLVNFLLFLYNARYPTLLTRFLNLRYKYAQKSVSRNVSFDFLNRQLVWEAFTEFLLFLMPLIDLPALRRAISKTLSRHSSLSSVYSLLPVRILQLFGLPLPPPKALHKRKESIDGKEQVSEGPLAHLPANICPICYSNTTAPSSSLTDPSAEITDPIDPTTSTSFLASLTNTVGPNLGSGQEVFVPYKVNCCGGLYCYYCISSALLKWEQEQVQLNELRDAKEKFKDSQDPLEQGWNCLRCGQAVVSIERFVGDDFGVV